jgi:hypothetical protein
MRKTATKRLRAPIAQSQACVFSVASGVFTLVKGNMRCVNLRLNAQRTTLSNNGPNNGNRSGLFTPTGWLYFLHIGRTSNFAFQQGTNITLIDPTVKIRERMNTWAMQSGNSIPILTNASEFVIARF